MEDDYEARELTPEEIHQELHRRMNWIVQRTLHAKESPLMPDAVTPMALLALSVDTARQVIERLGPRFGWTFEEFAEEMRKHLELWLVQQGEKLKQQPRASSSRESFSVAELEALWNQS